MLEGGYVGEYRFPPLNDRSMLATIATLTVVGSAIFSGAACYALLHGLGRPRRESSRGAAAAAAALGALLANANCLAQCDAGEGEEDLLGGRCQCIVAPGVASVVGGALAAAGGSLLARFRRGANSAEEESDEPSSSHTASHPPAPSGTETRCESGGEPQKMGSW